MFSTLSEELTEGYLKHHSNTTFFKSMANPDKDVTGEQNMASDEGAAGLGFHWFLSADF